MKAALLSTVSHQGWRFWPWERGWGNFPPIWHRDRDPSGAWARATP